MFYFQLEEKLETGKWWRERGEDWQQAHEQSLEAGPQREKHPED